MKFSIITPVFNRADCVARCIESVINQKHSQYSDWECEHIIVNDGSKDDTDRIVKEYAAKVPNIVYINFEVNKGTNAARNAAIKAATGDFCIILDSDDFFVENALETISATMQEKPGYKHYMFTPDDRQDEFNCNEKLRKGQVITFDDFLALKYNGDFIHVIKRETMQKYPFDEALRIYEGPFFLRFYKEAKEILFTNIVVTIRERNRNDSVSKEYIKTDKSVIKKAIAALHIKTEWFKDDYIRLGLERALYSQLQQLVHNLLLINDYSNCRKTLEKIKELGLKVPFKFRTIHGLRLGSLYFFLYVSYIRLKYKFTKLK